MLTDEVLESYYLAENYVEFREVPARYVDEDGVVRGYSAMYVVMLYRTPALAIIVEERNPELRVRVVRY